MLLDRVEEIVWRFRDTQGDWRDEWTPSQPDLLPRAVEMRITRTGEPSVTLRFLVGPGPKKKGVAADGRSEEHTSELQSLMRISYAVFCLKKKKKHIKSTLIYCENKDMHRTSNTNSL